MSQRKWQQQNPSCFKRARLGKEAYASCHCFVGAYNQAKQRIRSQVSCRICFSADFQSYSHKQPQAASFTASCLAYVSTQSDNVHKAEQNDSEEERPWRDCSPPEGLGKSMILSQLYRRKNPIAPSFDWRKFATAPLDSSSGSTISESSQGNRFYFFLKKYKK